MRLMLALEFVLLYVGLPLGYRLSPWPLPALPVLWVGAVYCFWVLRRKLRYGRDAFWDPATMTPRWLGMVLFFTAAAGLIALGVWRWAPELLFSMVRQHPLLWAVVMVLYPLLSVFPQGVVYRMFLFRRYGPLLGNRPWAIVLLSACCFAFMHIVFRNPIAVALTFAGGLLFAWRYRETGSLIGTSTEHALYGCWMFTVGLGAYFYHGTYRMAAAMHGR